MKLTSDNINFDDNNLREANEGEKVVAYRIDFGESQAFDYYQVDLGVIGIQASDFLDDKVTDPQSDNPYVKFDIPRMSLYGLTKLDDSFKDEQHTMLRMGVSRTNELEMLENHNLSDTVDNETEFAKSRKLIVSPTVNTSYSENLLVGDILKIYPNFEIENNESDEEMHSDEKVEKVYNENNFYITLPDGFEFMETYPGVVQTNERSISGNIVYDITEWMKMTKNGKRQLNVKIENSIVALEDDTTQNIPIHYWMEKKNENDWSMSLVDDILDRNFVVTRKTTYWNVPWKHEVLDLDKDGKEGGQKYGGRFSIFDDYDDSEAYSYATFNVVKPKGLFIYSKNSKTDKFRFDTNELIAGENTNVRSYLSNHTLKAITDASVLVSLPSKNDKKSFQQTGIYAEVNSIRH